MFFWIQIKSILKDNMSLEKARVNKKSYGIKTRQV